MRKSLIKSLALVLGLGLATSAFAAPGVRGAKGVRTVNFSATAVLACRGPATVYSVILSSGAATDYAVLRDSNTANTTSSPVVSIPHITTGVTQLTFDPPIIFANGVSFNTAATNIADSVVCTTGKDVQGY